MPVTMVGVFHVRRGIPSATRPVVHDQDRSWTLIQHRRG
jgi:hypothetical protein